MAPTQAEAEQLQAAASAIALATASLANIQTRLTTNLSSILDGDAWRGAAQQMFGNLYPAYDRQVQNLYRSLEDLGQRVSGASGEYQAAEDGNAQLVGSVDLGAGIVGGALGTKVVV